MLRKYSFSHHKTGAILHVSAGISARSLIPKVGSLRETISAYLGAAISLTDPTTIAFAIGKVLRSQRTGCRMGAKRRTLSVTNGWYHRRVGSKESPFHTSQTTPTRLEHLHQPESTK